MNIEEPIPFLEQFQELTNSKVFRKTLILWLYYKARMIPAEVARLSDSADTTVRRTIEKWKIKGTIKDEPGRGRTPNYTPEEEEKVFQAQLKDRFRTTKSIVNKVSLEGHELSYDQGKRIIRKKFDTEPVPRRIKIRPENKIKRLDWIQGHEDWRSCKWRNVIWTDEKNFELYPQGQQLFARILPDEDPEDFAAPLVQQGGEKVMFWGAIGQNGQIYLDVVKGNIKSKTYCSFLKERALPAIRKSCQYPFLFQQDNAPGHAAGATKVFFRGQGVQLLPWPPQSPDLNPMEMVWAWMVHQLTGVSFEKIHDLTARVFFLWEKMEKDMVLAFINSVPLRMQYIKQHNGDLFSVNKYRSECNI